jgi:hypothetical protein
MFIFRPVFLVILSFSGLLALTAFPQMDFAVDSAWADSPRDRSDLEVPSPSADEALSPAENEEPAHPSHPWYIATLLYLPNRVLDFLDIFRLRVRVGPGIGVGARITEVVQLYFGSYAAIYAGLPGPRLRRIPRSPVGLESHSGVSISVLDATVDGGIGPGYSPTEVGAGLHLVVLGLDVGIDPVEIADFFSGIFTYDIRNDDL